MTQIITSPNSTSNLSMNSTLHNQQTYTPATQSKVQQHWHQWKVCASWLQPIYVLFQPKCYIQLIFPIWEPNLRGLEL